MKQIAGTASAKQMIAFVYVFLIPTPLSQLAGVKLDPKLTYPLLSFRAFLEDFSWQ
jgi:hypothetical protein